MPVNAGLVTSSADVTSSRLVGIAEASDDSAAATAARARNFILGMCEKDGLRKEGGVKERERD